MLGLKLLAILTNFNVSLPCNLFAKDEKESKKENRFGKSTYGERILNPLETTEDLVVKETVKVKDEKGKNPLHRLCSKA